MTNFLDHGVLKHGPFMEPVVQIRLYDIFKKYSYMLLGVAILLSYVALVQYLRFSNVNSLKAKYGFSDDSRSYEHMTVEQAQEVERNLAEWDFPFLFEFGWIIEFLKVCGQSISRYFSPFLGTHSRVLWTFGHSSIAGQIPCSHSCSFKECVLEETRPACCPSGGDLDSYAFSSHVSY